MNKIYLKTYCYVPHEIRFLKMNLMESYDYIDKFIVCEFNRTHTGRPKEYIFDLLFDQIPEEYRDKILYLQSDISQHTIEAYDNEAAIHAVNEPVMRSFFMKELNFDDEDVIISIDADEIIYRDAYPDILRYVEKNNLARLNLHQFFYKFNYLWKGKDFTSPIAAKYKVFKNNFPCNWRDVGTIIDGKAGCHFSWCMTPQEMVYKLHTYSHPRYRFCADEDILRNAIESKLYPFDEDVDFDILELKEDDERLPKCLRGNISKFMEY
jgi:hypothetical protein